MFHGRPEETKMAHFSNPQGGEEDEPSSTRQREITDDEIRRQECEIVNEDHDSVGMFCLRFVRYVR